ncbi:MAG: hypothetical protein M3Q95_13730 [Bacteroidota bacterium]|nr:hypothetical protein [Bacteroidota bacterium]
MKKPANHQGRILPIYKKIISSRFILLIAVFCFFSFSNAIAQSVPPPIDSYISIENNVGTVLVSIIDSTTVNEIEVSLGMKGSFNDLFSYSYAFDQSTGLPSGLTYSREKLNVFLGVGSLDFPPAFNVRVRIKDNSGNWSPYLEYISN